MPHTRESRKTANSPVFVDLERFFTDLSDLLFLRKLALNEVLLRLEDIRLGSSVVGHVQVSSNTEIKCHSARLVRLVYRYVHPYSRV